MTILTYKCQSNRSYFYNTILQYRQQSAALSYELHERTSKLRMAHAYSFRSSLAVHVLTDFKKTRFLHIHPYVKLYIQYCYCFHGCYIIVLFVSLDSRRDTFTIEMVFFYSPFFYYYFAFASLRFPLPRAIHFDFISVQLQSSE